MAYSPKKLKPVHLQMIRLYWQGETVDDIAMQTAYTPQQVSNIVNCEEGQRILAALREETLDTMREVEIEAQFAAPILWDNVFKLANSASDERVRLSANLAALGIAGHVATRKVVITDDTAEQKKYDEMTEDEIRDSIRSDLLGSSGHGAKPILQ